MMSQMPQPTALSRCPSCEEPLEAGDRFCGACGYDLSAVPAPPQDHPTIAMNGSSTRPSEAAASRDWPLAPEPASSDTSAPVHRATDIRGTDSGGSELPHPDTESAAAQHPGDQPSGGQPSGVRFDRPPEPDEYPLAPPAGAPAGPVVDPRTADLGSPVTPPAGTKLCVACRSGHVDSDGYCENCGHAQPRERDHMEQELGAVAAVSDRGLRHHRNEDAFAISSTALPDGSPAVVAIVCDGVSSATRPDEASLAASRAAGEALLAALPLGTHPQQAMHEAILAAAEAVNSLAEAPPAHEEHAPHQNAPACTLVGAVVTPALLIVGWVGDSRAYWVPVDRSSPPARLTEDDSWAAQMVAAGLMSEAQAYADERAHAITGWLGADAYELEPHTASFKPDRPGVVVVCTDGLWNYAEAAEEMAEVVPLDAAERPLHSAQVLVGHALDGGGHDNVTVAVVPFPAPPQGAGSA
ncbi:PP2C family serine/threonine-protein phosphatase [Streptomyces sp. AK02-04a]|uniref:PP2C family serine/threonine-protein phosphatase n=1 Tax=Streptomyces sp. AK02-04a TaxID=3028649 RepID=UPI0029A7333D|nr:PP2C family serine/threonine-protein phosphatase [Streptomyces sp. AK02-04a]MDX3754441.1 protein phosphatase 2C domain-containing protein [Streptomyces sp. AK02-04a]